MDRIDLQVEVDAVNVEDIATKGEAESSESVKQRVQSARKMQLERYQGTGMTANAQVTGKMLQTYIPLDDVCTNILNKAVQKLNLSMRGYVRVIKVARTIADLQGKKEVQKEHILEAISYRTLDQKYWGN